MTAAEMIVAFRVRTSSQSSLGRRRWPVVLCNICQAGQWFPPCIANRRAYLTSKCAILEGTLIGIWPRNLIGKIEDSAETRNSLSQWRKCNRLGR
jgi:hypothetical protein